MPKLASKFTSANINAIELNITENHANNFIQSTQKLGAHVAYTRMSHIMYASHNANRASL